jgi:N-acetylmuramoyl-L-alanine amidase
MRSIDTIILHYTATPPGMDIGVNEVRQWHVEERGWSDIGYHYLIRIDGTIEVGRPLEDIGAHCEGHNECSVGVAYVGGLDENGNSRDTRTALQHMSIEVLTATLRALFGPVPLLGHREMEGAATECPGFDPSQEALVA